MKTLSRRPINKVPVKLSKKEEAELLINMYTNWLINNKGISTELEQVYVSNLLAAAKKIHHSIIF